MTVTRFLCPMTKIDYLLVHDTPHIGEPQLVGIVPLNLPDSSALIDDALGTFRKGYRQQAADLLRLMDAAPNERVRRELKAAHQALEAYEVWFEDEVKATFETTAEWPPRNAGGQ